VGYRRVDMSTFKIINDDCINAMQQMDESIIDSVVCDPPYGLAFMGKSWDHAVPGVAYWTEVFRVLKPGGYLFSFGGTRLFHRLTCAIEDSGFEIRDCVMWTYGSGFPKSHDVSKAIDKAAGAEREVIGRSKRHGGGIPGNGTSYEINPQIPNITAPATPQALKYQGWGTALKPAWEPIILARKPFKGTVANNVLEHDTGALNIDGCRVGDRSRWPANFVHDGSDEVLELFPKDEGRYFYCAKASQKERNEGLDALETGQTKGGGGLNNPEAGRIYGSMQTPQKNIHPTVKPIALMAWLCRMVTPEHGTVLDPFCGSGSTLVAAIREGFKCIGIEMEEKFADIARLRCEHEEW
jgi:site-specific DNA-methyltransferase (adenine-specific)